MKNNIAFVLGNGNSRKGISLKELKNHGTVYACNAVYRIFTPHYLVAVNPEMIFEIDRAKYQVYNKVWTNYNKEYEDLWGFNYFKDPKGWSSGPTALWLASNIGHTTIYILGFDFKGLNGKINNIYAGTPNYLDTDSEEVYYGNWLKHTAEVIEEYSNIEYVRVKNDIFSPKELSIYSNYKEETLNKFRERTYVTPN